VKALTDARHGNDDAAYATAMKNLTANASEIAKFLAAANPNLPEDAVRGLLMAHGGHHAARPDRPRRQRRRSEHLEVDAGAYGRDCRRPGRRHCQTVPGQGDVKPAALRELGATQQKLLRRLLLAPQGATIEWLCETLRITHNAVRQHLTVLVSTGVVMRGEARPTAGRPQSRYLLTAKGRDLFPRQYGLIATALLERLYARDGKSGVQDLLADMGRTLGEAAASRMDPSDTASLAHSLAEQLDALGYEAMAVRHGEETQVEAYNCVFHTLAKTHPDICRFDLSFMEAATGRPIQHLECLVRGGHACRFRILPAGTD
jgi:predicted ArsR family transcriptional regulator